MRTRPRQSVHARCRPDVEADEHDGEVDDLDCQNARLDFRQKGGDGDWLRGLGMRDCGVRTKLPQSTKGIDPLASRQESQDCPDDGQDGAEAGRDPRSRPPGRFDPLTASLAASCSDAHCPVPHGRCRTFLQLAHVAATTSLPLAMRIGAAQRSADRPQRTDRGAGSTFVTRRRLPGVPDGSGSGSCPR